MKNKNLEEMLEEPLEVLKSPVKFTGFCTIFLKRNNKALMTFDTLEGFTENHGKAVALMKGAMGNLSKEVFKVLREFVNQTGDLGGKDSEAQLFIDEFDKKFRVLVSEK